MPLICCRLLRPATLTIHMVATSSLFLRPLGYSLFRLLPTNYSTARRQPRRLPARLQTAATRFGSTVPVLLRWDRELRRVAAPGPPPTAPRLLSRPPGQPG